MDLAMEEGAMDLAMEEGAMDSAVEVCGGKAALNLSCLVKRSAVRDSTPDPPQDLAMESPARESSPGPASSSTPTTTLSAPAPSSPRTSIMTTPGGPGRC